ncbi:MAG TPA: diacylglycerol kinase family protein [Anaerolineales bacterium]|nr:diacylglycerol kinase family protein [Anaerolineales bacterium]
MVTTSPEKTAQILVVHNPQASAYGLEPLRGLMDRHFAGRRVAYLECSRTEMAARLTPWLQSGVDLVVAAGGDGTVADIASALPTDGPPVGILPMGTGNVLVRELGIPLDLDKAAALVAGRHAVRYLDLLRVAERAFLISVSVGLSARAMHETTPARKKTFGKSSYLVTLFLDFFAMHPVTYGLEADGRQLQIRASDLMAANCGILGYRTLRWWPAVQPDDGHMDLCYLEAKTGFAYLWVVFNFLARNHIRSKRLDHIPVYKSVWIRTPEGLPVQGDGDLIGATPIEVRLEPRALKVVVPPAAN